MRLLYEILYTFYEWKRNKYALLGEFSLSSGTRTHLWDKLYSRKWLMN